jgi:hypothetical protein
VKQERYAVPPIEGAHSPVRYLQVIDLHSNRLISLPPDIGECGALESLRVSGNRLRALPPALQSCTRLKHLDVSDNNITCLPPPLGNCFSLETINASGNALVDVPSALGRLQRLRTLLLNGNGELKGIPGEILERCELLHTLELHQTLVTREVSCDPPCGLSLAMCTALQPVVGCRCTLFCLLGATWAKHAQHMMNSGTAAFQGVRLSRATCKLCSMMHCCAFHG